ncbi:MAG TPA: PDZ domain-containing protein [Chitinophagaceae bacterium]|nr:PDZ domain-containing protein [Chitinophagaceae bacterium]
MSSTKIKLLGLLILMGCVTVEASTFYTYKKPDGATIITNREVKEPGYELLNITIHQANGPILETRGLSNNSVSTSNVSKPTSNNSANTTNRKIDEPEDKRQPLIIHAAAPYLDDSYIASTKTVSTTNVSKYYYSANWQEDQKQNFEYLKPGEQVQVLEVAPGLESYQLYNAQGYAAIGQSIFRDWDVSKDSLINQAKKVGATFVTFSKYADSSITYSVKDNLNNLANTVNPKNLATIIDPNNLGIIYSYEVLFYVKDNYTKNPNAFGFRISDIPLEKRKTYQRNTGSYVENVVEGSRAYKANVLIEDVIIAINGNPISTLNDFFEIKEKELKKTKVLELKILRLVNNELKELNIPVNF